MSKISLIELSSLKKQFDEIIAWKSELKRKLKKYQILFLSLKKNLKTIKAI